MGKFEEVLKEKPIFLAPMAGFTDLPTRILVSRFGVGGTVSELVSAKGFIHSFEKCSQFMKHSPEENCFGIQLVGSVPGEMAYVAERVTDEFKPEFIDINMGCPVKKVVKTGSGVALMTNPKLAGEIVKEVVAATHLPVTVKMRTGITDSSDECFEVAKVAEENGARAIFIHGRSKKQMFSGEPAYDKMKKLKQTLSIPVIGNGGIKSVEDGIKMVEKTGCDGLMVGTGAIGKPWLFESLYLAIYSPNGGGIPPEPSLHEKIGIMIDHAEIFCELNQNKKLIPFRKQLLWYTKGWPSSAYLRRELVKVVEIEDLRKLMSEYIKFHKKD